MKMPKELPHREGPNDAVAFSSPPLSEDDGHAQELLDATDTRNLEILEDFFGPLPPPSLGLQDAGNLSHSLGLPGEPATSGDGTREFLDHELEQDATSYRDLLGTMIDIPSLDETAYNKSTAPPTDQNELYYTSQHPSLFPNDSTFEHSPALHTPSAFGTTWLDRPSPFAAFDLSSYHQQKGLCCTLQNRSLFPDDLQRKHNLSPRAPSTPSTPWADEPNPFVFAGSSPYPQNQGLGRFPSLQTMAAPSLSVAPWFEEPRLPAQLHPSMFREQQGLSEIPPYSALLGTNRPLERISGAHTHVVSDTSWSGGAIFTVPFEPVPSSSSMRVNQAPKILTGLTTPPPSNLAFLNGSKSLRHFNSFSFGPSFIATQADEYTIGTTTATTCSTKSSATTPFSPIHSSPSSADQAFGISPHSYTPPAFDTPLSNNPNSCTPVSTPALQSTALLKRETAFSTGSPSPHILSVAAVRSQALLQDHLSSSANLSPHCLKCLDTQVAAEHAQRMLCPLHIFPSMADIPQDLLQQAANCVTCGKIISKHPELSTLRCQSHLLVAKRARAEERKGCKDKKRFCNGDMPRCRNCVDKGGYCKFEEAERKLKGQSANGKKGATALKDEHDNDRSRGSSAATSVNNSTTSCTSLPCERCFAQQAALARTRGFPCAAHRYEAVSSRAVFAATGPGRQRAENVLKCASCRGAMDGYIALRGVECSGCRGRAVRGYRDGDADGKNGNYASMRGGMLEEDDDADVQGNNAAASSRTAPALPFMPPCCVDGRIERLQAALEQRMLCPRHQPGEGAPIDKLMCYSMEVRSCGNCWDLVCRQPRLSGLMCRKHWAYEPRGARLKRVRVPKGDWEMAAEKLVAEKVGEVEADDADVQGSNAAASSRTAPALPFMPPCCVDGRIERLQAALEQRMLCPRHQPGAEAPIDTLVCYSMEVRSCGNCWDLVCRQPWLRWRMCRKHRAYEPRGARLKWAKVPKGDWEMAGEKLGSNRMAEEVEGEKLAGKRMVEKVKEKKQKQEQERMHKRCVRCVLDHRPCDWKGTECTRCKILGSECVEDAQSPDAPAHPCPACLLRQLRAAFERKMLCPGHQGENELAKVIVKQPKVLVCADCRGILEADTEIGGLRCGYHEKMGREGREGRVEGERCRACVVDGKECDGRKPKCGACVKKWKPCGY